KRRKKEMVKSVTGNIGNTDSSNSNKLQFRWPLMMVFSLNSHASKAREYIPIPKPLKLSAEEDGRYSEALGKWEAAITLMPQKAVLHEQKAQVLLEIGDAWAALKAATRATELESSWCEAWITLGRAQLNFGEPDSALESFDKALSLKPESTEARDDRQMALHLVKRRKQLHSTGLTTEEIVVKELEGSAASANLI
ncbi:hypothetical protein Dimus_005316, partial [Dionaea muscipula]